MKTNLERLFLTRLQRIREINLHLLSTKKNLQ